MLRRSPTPRPARLLLCAPLALAAIACGGSSSETPWPVEPENTSLGPVGEASNGAAPVDAGAPHRGK